MGAHNLFDPGLITVNPSKTNLKTNLSWHVIDTMGEPWKFRYMEALNVNQCMFFQNCLLSTKVVKFSFLLYEAKYLIQGIFTIFQKLNIRIVEVLLIGDVLENTFHPNQDKDNQ